MRAVAPLGAAAGAQSVPRGARQDFSGPDFDADIIPDYLASSFSAMRDMGPAVYRPFMQDYLQWSLLARIVAKQVATR
jgi:hypothetical protein